MERLYNAVERRFSVREYASAPDEDALEALQNIAKELSARGVRIEVASSEKVFKNLIGARMNGTDAFAAIIAGADATAFAAGYIGEAFILECAAMGLGTCWLGLSYSKAAAAKAVTLREGERIVCLTPVGIANEEYKARPRRTLEDVTGLGAAELKALPRWQLAALECGRLAPSAVNKQPWAFRVGEGRITVTTTSGNFGYGRLDSGIAMLHIELGAFHAGVTGEWEAAGPDENVFIAHGARR